MAGADEGAESGAVARGWEELARDLLDFINTHYEYAGTTPPDDLRRLNERCEELENPLDASVVCGKRLFYGDPTCLCEAPLGHYGPHWSRGPARSTEGGEGHGGS